MTTLTVAALATLGWLLVLAGMTAGLWLVHSRAEHVDPVDEAIAEAAELCDPVAAEAERGVADLEAWLTARHMLTRPRPEAPDA